MEKTIEQLKMNKKGMENAILTLIQEFEKVNGVSVEGIFINSIDVSNRASYREFIKVVTTTIKI